MKIVCFSKEIPIVWKDCGNSGPIIDGPYKFYCFCRRNRWEKDGKVKSICELVTKVDQSKSLETEKHEMVVAT